MKKLLILKKAALCRFLKVVCIRRMFIYISLFFIFSISEISSQTEKENVLVVDYLVRYNSNKFIEKSAQLIYNTSENSSYYLEFENENINKENISEDESGTVTQTIVIDSKLKVKTNFIDYNKRIISSSESINFDDRIFKVIENLKSLKWDLTSNETSKIGDYLCNKATINFRGRNYVAWYTGKIPIAAGPWKFRGLPGLILEIYDETLKYEWVATKILYNKTTEFLIENNLKSTINDNKFIDISLKDFVILNDSLFYSKFRNLGQKIKSRQERGVDAEVKVNYNRLGKEIIYEWEEKTKQD